mmetsp:Transcript_15008/g.41263  ORF Transcript_15008/g.41263 Transcript_15008/m.41263 type:complete len:452 (+) Transcript_15008:129-1484(+)
MALPRTVPMMRTWRSTILWPAVGTSAPSSILTWHHCATSCKSPLGTRTSRTVSAGSNNKRRDGTAAQHALRDSVDKAWARVIAAVASSSALPFVATSLCKIAAPSLSSRLAAVASMLALATVPSASALVLVSIRSSSSARLLAAASSASLLLLAAKASSSDLRLSAASSASAMRLACSSALLAAASLAACLFAAAASSAALWAAACSAARAASFTASSTSSDFLEADSLLAASASARAALCVTARSSARCASLRAASSSALFAAAARLVAAASSSAARLAAARSSSARTMCGPGGHGDGDEEGPSCDVRDSKFEAGVPSKRLGGSSSSGIAPLDAGARVFGGGAAALRAAAIMAGSSRSSFRMRPSLPMTSPSTLLATIDPSMWALSVRVRKACAAWIRLLIGPWRQTTASSPAAMSCTSSTVQPVSAATSFAVAACASPCGTSTKVSRGP